MVCIYANHGIAYFEKEQRVSGNRRNLTYEQETALLGEFEKKAKAGQIITVNDIRGAYDERCGHESANGTIYKVLRRHGWRKIIPRSRHPKKASDEVINASKKLTLASKK